MSKDTITVLTYHRHKLSDLIPFILLSSLCLMILFFRFKTVLVSQPLHNFIKDNIMLLTYFLVIWGRGSIHSL
jgi:hypothetical protein